MSFPDLHTDDDGTVRFNDPVSPDDGIIPEDIKKILRDNMLHEALTTARPMIDMSQWFPSTPNWDSTSTTTGWYNWTISDLTSSTTAPHVVVDAEDTLSDKQQIKRQLVANCDVEIARWQQVEANTEDDYMLGVCYGTIQAYQNMKDYILRL